MLILMNSTIKQILNLINVNLCQIPVLSTSKTKATNPVDSDNFAVIFHYSVRNDEMEETNM